MKAISVKNIILAVALLTGMFLLSLTRADESGKRSEQTYAYKTESDFSGLGSFGAGLKLIQHHKNQPGC